MSPNKLACLALIAWSTGCAQWSGDGDVVSNTYQSFQNASQKRAFESGWLPKALPKSSTNIMEAHNIDSGELWLKFHCAVNDIRTFTRSCTPDTRARFPDPKRTSRNAPWWPKELTGDGDAHLPKHWQVMSCASMNHAEGLVSANIAIDTHKNAIWYWIVK
ncbi:MAG: hypothetical protein E6Q88_10280 [Lysobacteraceae bacterium]|nr:MAG: hypothetical protein E6Q88_10280 [Xanthomonadaceae bacterium]